MTESRWQNRDGRTALTEDGQHFDNGEGQVSLALQAADGIFARRGTSCPRCPLFLSSYRAFRWFICLRGGEGLGIFRRIEVGVNLACSEDADSFLQLRVVC